MHTNRIFLAILREYFLEYFAEFSAEIAKAYR